MEKKETDKNNENVKFGERVSQEKIQYTATAAFAECQFKNKYVFLGNN